MSNSIYSSNCTDGQPELGEPENRPDRSGDALVRKRNNHEFQTTVRFRSWRDAAVEAQGYDPRSSYTELFWLPILGPSAVWLLRRVKDLLEKEPHGFSIEIGELSVMLGLGSNTGRYSSVQKTLNRLVIFELARIMPSEAVSIRIMMPPLPNRYLARLPESLRREHLEQTGGEETSSVNAMRARARSLALSLVRLGQDRLAIEKQLLSWRIHPSLCYETLNWIQSKDSPTFSNEPDPTIEGT